MSANGSNRFLNIEDANLRVRSGNVHAKGITVGGITVGAAHGLQSVSDVSNTTSNTLQFTNATTSFKATSNIEVGGDVSYTSKPKISVESNVVTEYTGPHDRPLRKYPEVALTQNDESATSGYVASTTNVDNSSVRFAFNAFIDSFDRWQTGGGRYASGGIHTAGETFNDIDGNPHLGDWIQLQLPTKINLSRVDFWHHHTAPTWQPQSYVILGSNDGSSWKLIYTQTNSPTGERITEHLTTVGYFKYFRLVVKSLHGHTDLIIRHIQYYGHEEGSGSLDTTLKSVYNVPATTGTQLEVYYDAKDLADGAVTNVTDLSPNSNGGLPSDSPQVSNGAFVFDGVNDYIYNSQTGYTASDTYTASVWVKFLPDGGSSSDPCIFQFGNGSVNSSFGMISDSSENRIRAYIYANNNLDLDERVNNIWYHLCATYYASNGRIDFFINGILKKSTTSGTAMTIPSTPYLTLGAQTDNTNTPYAATYFTGSIANFRIYSKALNADQVKELYDYQKDYFLGSRSSVTLYKGNLGVGVAEPSGQLELAGDERIQEYPPRAMTKNETLVEGHGVFSALGGIGGETYAPWKAFDKSTSTFWIDTGIGYSDVAPYGPLSTHSKTTLYDGSVLSGGWIDLECPYPVKLKKVGTAPRTNYSSIGLQRGIILGSNNGVDWYQIDTIDYAGTTPPNTLTYFDITTETYYSHLRLVCTNLTARYPASGTSDMHWQMGELVYFGTPGPTTLDKGSLSLTRSLDVPRVSRYDVDTETPRPEKLLVDFDTTVNSSPTDISGQGNHGTMVGATYSPADKAFNFDGGDYIQGSLTNSSSNFTNTVSLWFKMDDQQSTLGSPGTTGNRRTIFEFGDIGNRTGLNFGFVDIRDTYMTIYMGDTATLPSSAFAPQQHQWHHLVLMYSGSGTLRIFIDNTEYTSSLAGVVNGTLAIQVNADLLLGSEGRLNAAKFRGDISNFKVYSVALEPSEVKKLYNLGRTGRSMVISDTAVGIGKVPEAQLDVRGNISCDGILKPYTCAFSAYVSSGGNSSATDKFPADGVHFNIGNCYDASTYEFTAPVYGIYHMSWSAYTNEAATTTSRIFAYQSNNLIEQKGHTIEKHGNSLSLTVRMQAGETFYFRGSTSYPIYYYAADGHNRFSGHLICAL